MIEKFKCSINNTIWWKLIESEHQPSIINQWYEQAINLRRNNIIEKIDLLKEIQWNRTKEQEVIQEMKKEDVQAWEDDGIVYVDGWIYIPNNKKIQE